MTNQTNIYAVIVSASYINARKLCEKIENTLYVSPPDYKGVGSSYILEEIQKEFTDLEGKISIILMTNFMDLVNDDSIDIENYFMSYVSYLDGKNKPTDILDDIQQDLADYQNEIGRGDMDDTQWQQLFIDRVVASITSYETIY
jgi:hypothetical protein